MLESPTSSLCAIQTPVVVVLLNNLVSLSTNSFCFSIYPSTLASPWPLSFSPIYSSSLNLQTSFCPSLLSYHFLSTFLNLPISSFDSPSTHLPSLSSSPPPFISPLLCLNRPLECCDGLTQELRRSGLIYHQLCLLQKSA